MGEYLELRLEQLVPNPDNPRETLGDLDELAASIDAIGVLQRLLVTPLDAGGYMVVDGHRRYWSCRAIDYTRPIPVEVRVMDRVDRITAAVAAGTFTRPISPIDQARAFAQLLELGLNQVQIAERTGVPQPTVSTRLRLLELPPNLQRDVHEGRMSLERAKQAVWALNGRRAPDKAPRQARAMQLRRTPVAAGSGDDVCETCGQPLPAERLVVGADPGSHLSPLEQPISRGEALAMIEAATR